ncbi:DUF6507 family protein [Curtobacterium sp. NPDC087080]|uniref:DUF6507 family protein n=1 Tax=Curtobacterium sp. NPDC087080 TaxID=3363965 RepID=UPI00381CEA95
MDQYAIDPGGVLSVLVGVDGRLEQLREADAAVVAAVEAALTAVGSSSARGGLERLAEDFRSVVPNLHEHIAAARTAATTATQAYDAADAEMAGRTPRVRRPEDER